TEHAGYTLSDEPSRIDFAKVTEWLAGSYWSPGIERAEVEHGARHSSLVVGAYAANGAQVGYARVASDRTRVGFVMDVFVDAAHRKRGLGRALVHFALSHPEHALVYLWLLATHDAHGVYAPLGFAPHPNPERVMLLKKPWPRP
ncbi:MAG TPA: GNAT family N-acetyltransferase, partial [Polyangiaceae bacterium]|nr:GNAT family N-acetyltransferase [Polyangiaceae bacterium]